MQNLLLRKILVFRNTSTNKKICPGLGVGRVGSNDLLGPGFYFELVNMGFLNLVLLCFLGGVLV